jgi:O-antigen/teichoic acid export membrane protein
MIVQRLLGNENRFVPFGADGDFNPTSGRIQQLAVRGAGATLFSSGATLGIQVIATLVLARLLSPSDFGVVAMVTTFSLLLTNFGLNGFTEAVLQREKINSILASNLFWINVGVGALLSVGLAAAGTLLARFYREPAVAPVSVGVAISVFVSSTSVIHLALLKRAMRFGAASMNDIVARFASVAVSIVLGLGGWRYWALVAGAIALPLSQSLGVWYLCRWKPGIPRSVAGTGSMLRFAMHVYSRFGVNYVARNMDNFLVGWRFGAYPLGFYKRAYDLFALPASQIAAPLSNVGVSVLSRFKNDLSQFQRYMVSAVALMAFAGMGLGADLTLSGKDIIRVVLGAKWDEAGRIFTFFGPGIGIMLVYYMQGWIYLSSGRAERWLRWSVFESLFTAFLFVLALPWGPSGIAFAWTLSFWTLLLPGFWYAARPLGTGIMPIIHAIWRYVLGSLLAAIISAVIMRGPVGLSAMQGATGALARIAVVSVLFWLLYLVAIVILHRGTAPLVQFANLAKDMLPQGRWLKSRRADGTSQPQPAPVQERAQEGY